MCDQDLERQTLAACASLGSITLCPCGTVSLNVGGVSVRMELSAFVQAARMCHTAVVALDNEVRALGLGTHSPKPGMVTH